MYCIDPVLAAWPRSSCKSHSAGFPTTPPLTHLPLQIPYEEQQLSPLSGIHARELLLCTLLSPPYIYPDFGSFLAFAAKDTCFAMAESTEIGEFYYLVVRPRSSYFFYTHTQNWREGNQLSALLECWHYSLWSVKSTRSIHIIIVVIIIYKYYHPTCCVILLGCFNLYFCFQFLCASENYIEMTDIPLLRTDYTLNNPDTLTKYKTAAQISHKVLETVTGAVSLPLDSPACVSAFIPCFSKIFGTKEAGQEEMKGNEKKNLSRRTRLPNSLKWTTRKKLTRS